MRLVPHREIGLDDDGIRRRPLGVEHPPEVKQRELRADANGVRPGERCEAVGALRLGRAGASRVRDLDDEGNPVAFGDGLAELAHETGS